MNLEFSSLTSELALGLIWKIQKDTFTFKPIIKYYTNAKRGILSLMSSIFNPLGILTPCLFESKHIVQQLWKQNIDCDELIPSSLLKQWEVWKEYLLYGFGLKHNLMIELSLIYFVTPPQKLMAL